MESIFDLASPDELAAIFGPGKYPGDKQIYDTERRQVAASPDYHLALLAGLYADRGDKDKAEACLNAIKDDQRRLDTMLMLYECEFV